jgi:hypothetical protein
MVLLRRAFVFLLLGLAGALLLSSCSLPWQHSSAGASSVAPKPTAEQLIAALQKNFRSVTSFHVVMQTQNLGPATSSQVQIRSASGDIIMPDKIKAQATVILSGQAVTVNLISIGDTQYITDPITGQWRTIKGVLDPRTLTNPKTGILSLVGKLEKLTGPTDDVVGGVPCWRITGELDAKYIAFFTGGGVPAGTMLETSGCIGKADGLPYQLSVTGEAAPGDTPQTVRSFNVSDYNENISITAPQVP